MELDDALERIMALDAEETLPDEILGPVVSSSVFGFDQALQRLREAVAAEPQVPLRHERRPRPGRVADAGAALTRTQRERVEQVIDRYFHDLADVAEEVLGSTEEGSAGRATLTPIAPEWGTAGVLLSIGPARLRSMSEQVHKALGDLGSEASNYGFAYFSWKASAQRPSPVLGALVVGAVAEFGFLLGSLLRIGVTLYPAALRVEEKQFSVSEYNAAGGTSGAIRRLAIDKIVDDYLHEGILEWVRRLRKWPGIDLQSLSTNWADVVEIFLRRNVIVHNSSRVDETYLRLVPPDASRPALGAYLETDAQYVTTAIDRLWVLGDALAFLWTHQLRPSAELDPSLATNCVYRLLERGQWADAELLAGRFLEVTPSDETRGILLVNRWMAAREMQGSPSGIRDDVVAWSPPDSDRSWRIAKAALLMDGDETARELRNALRDGEELRRYERWPLLRVLGRRDAKVRQALMSGRRQQVPGPRRARR